MERTWMILARVIRVPPAEAQAQPEQAAVGEAEQLAQAEQAEDAAQAQHAAAVEAEVAAARAVLEYLVDRVDRVAAAANNLGEPGFTVSVAPPARVTFLTARPNSHPDGQRRDRHPYIIATGSFCLLVHFAAAPYYGTDFRPSFAGRREERDGDFHHLIVVRHFRRAGGEIAASAVRVPARPHDVPAFRNVESVGFVCDGYNKRRFYDYTIAELVVHTGRAKPSLELVIFRSDRGYWFSESGLESPLVDWDAYRRWVPHGAVAVGSTVMWFDLSWGILACDVEQEASEDFEFRFYRLPPHRGLEKGRATEDIHNKRCIAVSGDLLRYVEIIPDANPNPNPNDGAATVSMWSLVMGHYGMRWIANYGVAIQEIWNSQSYADTGLPQNIPVLAGVSPANPAVVYFDLNHRLFGVNVPERRVVDYEANEHELVNVPGPWEPQSRTGSSRYLVTWNLQRPGTGVIIGPVSPHLQEGGFPDDKDDEPQDPKGKGKGKSKATDGRRKSTSASSRPNKSIRIK